jgi:hypothetical protein
MSNEDSMSKYETMDENQKNMIHKMIEMVTRQTTYTYEEAKSKVIEHNFDFTKVVREYMGITKKEEINTKSVNQQIYTEIRDLMDTAASSYRYKQELNEAHAKQVEQAKKTEDEIEKELTINSKESIED